jgi:hypothetical protein
MIFDRNKPAIYTNVSKIPRIKFVQIRLHYFPLVINLSVLLKMLENLEEKIIEVWGICEKTPGIFRYKLKIDREKVIDGNFGFYIQVSFSDFQ